MKTASPSAASLAFRWGGKVPDHTRIWAFRQKLAELGLDKKLFEEFNRQIEAQGLLVKKGTLIDATIIKAVAKAPKGDDGALSDMDPEAGWTKKNGVSTYGYKDHVDEGSGIPEPGLEWQANPL